MATTKAERAAMKVKTTAFRGSFVNLLKARAQEEGAEAKFGMTVVLPKDSPFWKRADAAVTAACEAKWGKRPAKLKYCELGGPWRDGDDSDYEEFAGCYTMNVTSRDKVPVHFINEDGELERTEESARMYSGAFYKAELKAYAWDNKFGKGVSFNLDNVLFIRDGEAFAGRQSAAAAFADEIEEAAGGESSEDRLGLARKRGGVFDD